MQLPERILVAVRVGVEVVTVAVLMHVVDAPVVVFVIAAARGASATEAKNREVGEMSLETGRIPDPLTDRLDLRRRQPAELVASLADQVGGVAVADQRVEPGAMTDVNVPNHAQPLEELQVPVGGWKVAGAAPSAEPPREEIGRHRPLRSKQTLEDDPAARRHPVALSAQHRRCIVDVDDLPWRAIGGRWHLAAAALGQSDRPALLDPAEAPDAERDDPGENEDGGDRVADVVEVES